MRTIDNRMLNNEYIIRFRLANEAGNRAAVLSDYEDAIVAAADETNQIFGRSKKNRKHMTLLRVNSNNITLLLESEKRLIRPGAALQRFSSCLSEEELAPFCLRGRLFTSEQIKG